MRNTIELTAENFRVYEIRTFMDEVLPAYAVKLETLFVSRVDFKKLSKFRMIGILDISKPENEEPTAEELINATLTYLIYITDYNPTTGKAYVLFPGPENLNWSTTICMNSDISVNIKNAL